MTTPIAWRDLSGVEVPAGWFVPGTAIEVIRSPARAGRPRGAFFDFDGTLSLIRAGWMDVMVPMMVEELQEAPGSEDAAALTAEVREMVYRLTGHQTIYQMMALAEEVERRGGRPLDPLDYKREYRRRLMARIGHRLEGLRSGATAPDQLLVPGARAVLTALRDRGVPLACASGTDQDDCREEARLLRIAEFFEGRLHGAVDDYRAFSKGLVVRRLREAWGLAAGDLVGFGDGFVEVEEVKAVGGIAVGLATAEPECRRVDDWKRKRLILAGADFIVPNFLEHEALLKCLEEGVAP